MDSTVGAITTYRIQEKDEMTKSIYVGLPVTNLVASTQFYEALGFRKDAKFSDDTTSTMVWSDTITFQLQTHSKFKGWVSKEVANARTTSEVLLTLSQDTREGVDAVVMGAAEAGGKASTRPPIDLGWLYNRSFEDPDGHMFEAVWLDPKGAASM
jgi:predicted lactoylglutathione lyase